MTSGLKVGGGLVQNTISESISMMTSHVGGWGAEWNVIIKNGSHNLYLALILQEFPTNIMHFLSFKPNFSWLPKNSCNLLIDLPDLMQIYPFIEVTFVTNDARREGVHLKDNLSSFKMSLIC